MMQRALGNGVPRVLARRPGSRSSISGPSIHECNARIPARRWERRAVSYVVPGFTHRHLDQPPIFTLEHRLTKRPVDEPKPASTEEKLPELQITDEAIVITWDGSNTEQYPEPKPSVKGIQSYPHQWLRDHCHCNECVNQDTMQRAFDTFAKENRDIKPFRVELQRKGLEVTWGQERGHTSRYPWKWLYSHLYPKHTIPERYDQLRLWNNSSFKQKTPSVPYDLIMSDGSHGLSLWAHQIYKWGFCYVDGCPVSPKKTEQLLEKIAPIRVTHYGGFYDFTSDLTMKDTAYTSLALPAHTDTTYFTDPAGLQMFHLLSHTEGSGGSSLLVDGFKCAKTLRVRDPEAYHILSTVPVQWHASGNEGIIVTPSQPFPVFNHRKVQTRKGGPIYEELQQIRWNNDDRAALPLWCGEDPGFSIKEWYRAAAVWSDLLRSPEFEYWEQLVPGRPLIFNNWRVLHGRSAFTGKRRICGGYINRDDFVSTYLRMLTRESVLSRIL